MDEGAHEVTKHPCAICGQVGQAKGWSWGDEPPVFACERCMETIRSLPLTYGRALLTLGKAPEWQALSPERREAIDAAFQTRKDIDKVVRVLADPDFPEEHRAVKEGVDYVNALRKGAGYRAEADPKAVVEDESTFQMVAITLVEECATSGSAVESALAILRLRYPRFPINESTFEEAVRAWATRVKGGKWPVLVDLVGWEGDPEVLKIRFSQWKKSELGSAVQRARRNR